MKFKHEQGGLLGLLYEIANLQYKEFPKTSVMLVKIIVRTTVQSLWQGQKVL